MAASYRLRVPASALVLVLAAAVARAQAGDRDGEAQPPLPEDLVVPPAPVLSPTEALAAFDLEDGPWRLELFAAEPLVEDPVWMAWDEDGRAWVVEMRGYMPDADGTGERAPVGEVAILEDTDGDGRADRRTTFLDGLVLPRAVHPCEGGALVIAPPNLSLWTDTDGDGRADHEERIRDVGTLGLENPEHAVNALTMTFEGTWQVANASFEFWRGRREWEFRRTAGGGQWGLGIDARGRRYFNTNPDPLRGDLYPSRYAVRNANHGRAKGVNVRWAHAMETWPARMNPGVNRGYQEPTLRDDWTLAKFTAACGPHVYEGGRAWLDGSAFVCEPAGNLVKRFRIVEDGLRVRAEPTSERDEFLRSTDERFRPVQVATGPEGALYVVDFYRGLVQHRVFLTTFLRRQAEARGLVAPTGLGRIWRVVPTEEELVLPPGLGDARWTDLVERLGHANGFWRRTATRVLVEEARDDRVALEVLRRVVDGGLDLTSTRPSATPGDPALVLAGCLRVLHRLERTIGGFVLPHLSSEDEDVALAALVASEPFLRSGDEDLALLEWSCAARARPESSPRVRLQALLTLTESRAADPFHSILLGLADAPDPEVWTHAALSGLEGRELAMLEYVLAGKRDVPERLAIAAKDESAPVVRRIADTPLLVRLLARAVVREGRSERVDRLVALTVEHAADEHLVAAMKEGLLDARPPGRDGAPSWIRLAAAPTTPEADVDPEVWAALAWPGRADLPPEAEVRALDADEQLRFDRGRALYANVCAACHQDHGRGEPGKAPALRHSPFVLGDETRLVRIVSGGLVGPVEVHGERFDAEMPAWGASDDDLAAVLTYLRRGWDHVADPVTSDDVARVRAADRGRATPWTVERLGD